MSRIEAARESSGFLQPEHRLTHRQYAAIGRVAVLWAEVEFAMERILTRLALAPQLLGFVLTDKLGPDNRIGAIKSLVNVHKVKYHSKVVDKIVLDEIRRLLPHLATMKGDRNFVVHSLWMGHDEELLSTYSPGAAARSGMDVSIGRPEKLQAIEMFGDDIDAAATRLQELGDRIPMIDATLLHRLNELAARNRRLPVDQSTRQVQPRSYGKLPAEPSAPATPEEDATRTKPRRPGRV